MLSVIDCQLHTSRNVLLGQDNHDTHAPDSTREETRQGVTRVVDEACPVADALGVDRHRFRARRVDMVSRLALLSAWALGSSTRSSFSVVIIVVVVVWGRVVVVGNNANVNVHEVVALFVSGTIGQDLAGIPSKDVALLESALGIDAYAAIRSFAELEVVLPGGHRGGPALESVTTPWVRTHCFVEVSAPDTVLVA
jgi:hypothetical protein